MSVFMIIHLRRYACLIPPNKSQSDTNTGKECFDDRWIDVKVCRAGGVVQVELAKSSANQLYYWETLNVIVWLGLK